MKRRFWIALWAAKLSIPVLKITKHNGTNFPGKLAIRICPDFLKYVDKPERIIAITGTNGKTTVTNMICDIWEGAGKRVLHNRAGSNIDSGIATSLLSGCTIFNHTRYEMAVIEVDERSSRKIYPFLHPEYILITNLFRDSIMRNAHPQYIADILSESIPEGTKLILNADDLICSNVALNNPRVYFGLEKMDSDTTECVNLINDMRICPKCSGELKYEYRRYHHIGKARCMDCGFRSPDYDYAGANIDLERMSMTVKEASGSFLYPLISDNVVNIYNMVTVIALCRELGMSHEAIAEHLGNSEIVPTRFHAEKAGDVTIVMQMAKDKNALACSRVFDYIAHQPGKKEALLLMNCLEDEKTWSENTCWLYDCDFEFLKAEGITRIVASGPRAKDYRLRLLLAGVPKEHIECVADESEAAAKLQLDEGSFVFLLYGTDSLSLAFKVREKVRKMAEYRAKSGPGVNRAEAAV